jgi:urease accessory protein
LEKLLAWLSPGFPVGAYSYSHGLEWVIEDGAVSDAETLQAWITDVLRHGGGRADAAFLVDGHHAIRAANLDRFAAINRLATAFQPSRERYLETTAQGRAFWSTIVNAWPSAATIELAEVPCFAEPLAYPLAVAAATAAHGIPVKAALTAYLAAFAGNLVSAGVRAIPIGHTDGQRVTAAVRPVIGEITEGIEDLDSDTVGTAAFRADIASIKHETQYTRLFRS